jgi:peptidoglycan hydrolase-like protein with peptidoglycan-binding domain
MLKKQRIDMEIYKIGSRGEVVRQIQKALHIAADGIYGKLTAEAVTAFQRYAGFTPNGAVGAVTWDGIAGLYSDLRFGYEKRPYQAPGYVIR